MPRFLIILFMPHDILQFRTILIYINSNSRTNAYSFHFFIETLWHGNIKDFNSCTKKIQQRAQIWQPLSRWWLSCCVLVQFSLKTKALEYRYLPPSPTRSNRRSSPSRTNRVGAYSSPSRNRKPAKSRPFGLGSSSRHRKSSPNRPSPKRNRSEYYWIVLKWKLWLKLTSSQCALVLCPCSVLCLTGVWTSW